MVSQVLASASLSAGAFFSILWAQDSPLPSATPTTILATFLSITTGAFVLLGWAYRKQMELNQKQQSDHVSFVMQHFEDLAKAREDMIELTKAIQQCLANCTLRGGNSHGSK